VIHRQGEIDMAIKKVGILGCGLMGSGIAQVAAQAGYETVVREVSRELLDRGLDRIRNFLDKGIEKGKVTREQADQALGNITGTLEIKDLADCGIVIEAVTENLDLKIEMLRTLDGICPPETIFASNTSSLTVTSMAMATNRPDKVLGLHFFNPVPLMKLVEVVRTVVTDEKVFTAAFDFCKTLGKVPVAARDNSGFIVNLLLVPYLLDAIRAFEKGVASIEDIDKGMMLGCGYPMGPFTLLDFVGLDTTVHIANIMFEEYRESRYAPPPLLKRMVLAGYYGRKSGKGFYDYSGDAPIPSQL
jgi:3-hydroxybutyryl-CoA dehydrogenase